MNIRIPGSPWVRVVAVVVAAAGLAALLWWRGPDWGTVWHAFDAVKWYWVVAAIGLNLLSVIVRALAWQTVIKQALPPPHPRFGLVFSGVTRRSDLPVNPTPDLVAEDLAGLADILLNVQRSEGGGQGAG